MRAVIVSILVVVAACGAGAGAPGGRVGYIVTARDDTPAGRQKLHEALVAEAGAGEDVSGDGFVVRLDAAARARVAALPGVAAVTPLDAAARIGAMPAGAPTDVLVRVDLFDDASAAEADEVAAWIGAHGGHVVARDARSIRARVSAATATAATSLAPVRWIEAVPEDPRR